MANTTIATVACLTGYDEVMERRATADNQAAEKEALFFAERTTVVNQALNCFSDVLMVVPDFIFEPNVTEIPLASSRNAKVSMVYRPPQGVIPPMFLVEEERRVIQIALKEAETLCGYRAIARLADCHPDESTEGVGLTAVINTLYSALGEL